MSQARDTSRFSRPSQFFTTNSVLVATARCACVSACTASRTAAGAQRLFSQSQKPPAAGARIVYCDGAWDMFHAGHIATLEKAKKVGRMGCGGLAAERRSGRAAVAVPVFCLLMLRARVRWATT